MKSLRVLYWSLTIITALVSIVCFILSPLLFLQGESAAAWAALLCGIVFGMASGALMAIAGDAPSSKRKPKNLWEHE